MKKLLSNYALGDIQVKNRVAMSPMTRNRCDNNIPGDLVATYYQQRSEAGLLITEGASPSPNGLGYPRIPGAFNSEQAAGWKKVAEAIHHEGSRIFMQLMHTGRVGHPLNLPTDGQVMGPSPVALEGEMYTDGEGPKPHPVPTEMSEADIKSTIEEYAATAENVVTNAHFDGVEIHGANGYLVDQFLNTASNQRTDQWGGTIDGRIQFAVEVTRAVAQRIGPNRVGIRLSPYGAFNGMVADDQQDALFTRLTKELNDLHIAYIHIVDHSSMGAPEVSSDLKQAIRNNFQNTIILSGGYDSKRAEEDLNQNNGDMIAFGRPFISNPRLISAFKNDAKLREPNYDLFYTPGPEGYTDYPL